MASLESSSGIVLTPSGRPLELYDVVEKVYHRDIRCELYCSRLEADELMAEFRPVAVVSQVNGEESAQIWPVPKAEYSSRRVALPLLAIVLIAAADVAIDVSVKQMQADVAFVVCCCC